MTITQFLAGNRITASVEWAEDNPQMADMPYGSNHWRVTFRMGRKRMTTPFSQGPAIQKEPTAADVFNCLLSDASYGDQSFDDFCGDMGYDTDSRNAERIHKNVTRMTRKLRQFLGGAYDAALACDRE